MWHNWFHVLSHRNDPKSNIGTAVKIENLLKSLLDNKEDHDIEYKESLCGMHTTAKIWFK